MRRTRALSALAQAAAVATITACAPDAGKDGDGTAAAAPSAASPGVPPTADTTPPSNSGGAPTPSADSPRPSRPSVGAAQPVADTVRGIVAVVGSEPMTQIVVRTAGGAPSVTVVGEAGAALRSLSGAEVVVRGARTTSRELRATSFTVRTVDGLAAADGVLERSGDGYALRLSDGTRRPVVRPSPALVAHLGARVWVTGPPNVEPQAFGLITP